MNRNRLPNGPSLIACCLALGALSGSSSWWVLTHSASFALLGAYLPGMILGFFICIVGQYALGWPVLPIVRALAVVFVCMAAWRLAQAVRQLGGPSHWITASLVGALGIAAAMLVAWPQRARRALALGMMTAAGLAGGLLFTVASELHLTRSGRSVWALLLLGSWQATMLTTAAFALRRSASE